MIHEIQVEVRESDLQPDRAAELLNRLSALLGNVNQEIREADMAYAICLLRCLEAEERANRAKILAETTPEYMRKREARDTKELALEMCRSLKYYLRAKEEELRLASH
jgi:hypothetical protein